MNKYDHRKVEAKWREKWLKEKLYQPDMKKAEKPFYNLMMFPYPSAEGLHVGNMYAFTGADIHGRYQRMMGNDVFEPIGLDGFGIHSENYAIKIGKHPAKLAKVSEERFYDQLRKIGAGFAWDSRLETYDADYYRWTQWLFVKMFKKGLVERKKSYVNWCPSCKTVLSDEQVEGGVCERCKSKTTRKETEQWFFKITEYAERLLNNIDKIDWPEKIKTAQRNWIGKSEGEEVDWDLEGVDKKLRTFTTRLDTIFGATFLVVAPEHPILKQMKLSKRVHDYIHEALEKTEQKRKAAEKEKTGVDIGFKAIHPLTGDKIPIFVADFVLMDYGTGVVMGVPAHDERDHDFAKEHDLPITKVIDADGKSVAEEAVVEHGKLVNSGEFEGMFSEEAMGKILEKLVKNGQGKKTVTYHLRDWLISRQRYWGPPIPMVYCEKCDWQPVKEEDLPVELPYVKDYKPSGDGKSPLEKAADEWLYTKCPKCGGKAKRETDVSDTFLDSSWYFLAYPNLKSSEWKGKRVPFNDDLIKRWLPVNAYIGGAEHAVLHLLYSRFVTMALKDWGYLEFEEPFPFLYGHGLLIKDGAKMSKSRGNVVIPDEYIEKYGADALRMYLMFLGPYDQGGDFRDSGIAGMNRFINRVWDTFYDKEKIKGETGRELLSLLHVTIKRMKEDLGKFRYNTAIAALMEFMNQWRSRGQSLSGDDAKVVIRLIAPLAPYMAEELWQVINANKSESFESVHFTSYPKHDPKLIESNEITIVVQVNGKVRDTLMISDQPSVINKDKVVEMALKSDRVGKWLQDKKVKDTVWIEPKSGRQGIVNFVL